jgi:ribonucleoside-diphosphate reductase alpha chain
MVDSKSNIKSDVTKEIGTWSRVFTKPGVHPFDEIEWKIVDAEIRKSNGSVAFSQQGVEVPAWWNQTTINIVADKYFRVINGVKESSVKQMFTRVADTLTSWAKDQNYFESDDDALVFNQELIFALLHQYGAFNSPVWFNLGIPNRRQAASACFISGVDDTLDGIMNFQKSESVIFAGGSGSGANLSTIRSSYEKLASGSYTSGPMSWMRGLDQYAMAMKSGGSTRNAAKMVVLDMDHPDILETKDNRPGFIRSKAVEEKLAHQLVDIGYSVNYDDPNGAYKRVMYQNANHSVSIPDAFMQSVIDDGTWQTKERKTGKTVHNYKARDLWNEIAEAAWVCGDPGVQFTDTINSWHTTPRSGKIKASNPCSEFLHVDNTACNLCAVNLTKFFDGKDFNYERFKQAIRLFTTSQMAIIAKADYPTDEITSNSHKLRPIGTNYGDLGALLMKLGYSYDSDGGRAVAARLASLMTGLTYLNAAKLAARVGAFAEFEKNKEDMLGIMHKHSEANDKILSRWQLPSDPIGEDIVKESAKVWSSVIELGSKYGFNISQATLQAPLGTISFLMGMDTTGIEPSFSLVSYKSMVGGGYIKLVNAAVRDSLVNLGYANDAVDTITKYIEENDCIEGAPGLNPAHLAIFDCAMPSGTSGRYLTPLAHIKMMAAIQPLITCAQSKTVNLPKTVTVQEIADIYLESWRLGLKCVALYRDGCKASQPLATKASDAGVKNEPVVEASVDSTRKPDSIEAIRDPMPNDVSGWRHKFEIDGYRGYIIVNEYPDGRPGEVFLRLGKPGSTISGLMNGFTQLLSIALQYRIPLPKLIGSFIDTRFEPAGITSNKQIRFSKSLYDYLFKVLDVRYYGGEHSGLADRISQMESSEPLNEGISSSAPALSAKPKTKRNLDAPPCNRCGSITQRNGSCYLCVACGTTTGCS